MNKKTELIDNILIHINKILDKNDKQKIENIFMDTKLIDIGLDSLDLAELTVRIESEFNIDIFENGIVETIEEIINILQSQKCS